MRTVERFALIFGVVNLVLGVLATFTPFVDTKRGRGPLQRLLRRRERGLINTRPGMLLGGLGAVNPPHAALHIALAAAGLATRRYGRFSRAYLWLNGILFAGLAALGWARVGQRSGIHTAGGIAFDRRGNIFTTLGAAVALIAALRSGRPTEEDRESAIPREKGLDHSLALLADGYRFISKRCQRFGTDIFETRLMFRKAVCMQGEEAAREFYVPGRFTRRGALPPSTLFLLQDRGSGLVLDGEAHRWRKQLLLSLMTPDSVQLLADHTAAAWRAALFRWQDRQQVELFEAVEEVLCRAACAWAGVPLVEDEVQQRTRELGAMIEGAGAFGPRNWRGQILRARTESWISGMIEQVRSGALVVPEGSAVDVIAWHKDMDGSLLEARVATVELINMLRPTVAVARYIVFAALALHEYPEVRQRVADEDEAYLEWFAHEVRRFYPFFPFLAGIALQEFEWRGHPFQAGDWVLLDIYGTNRDPRSWEEPDVFRPERFRDWNGSPYNFIPQGGGDQASNHRCAGEDATIALIKQAARLLVNEMQYDLPRQDLSFSLRKMPAIPKSRFMMTNVRQAVREYA